MTLEQQIAQVVRTEVQLALSKLSAPPSNSITPRYLTVPQAGKYIGMSTGSVYNLIAAKRIPAIKLGHRTVRLDLRDLDAFASRYRC